MTERKTEMEFTLKLNRQTVLLLILILFPIAYYLYEEHVKPHSILSPTATSVQSAAPAAANNDAIVAAKKQAEAKPSHDTYFTLGFLLYKNGMYKESIEATQKALTFDPKQAATWNNLAATYGSLQQWDEEIDACQKALALKPDFQLAKNNLNWALSQKQLKK